MDNSWLRKNGIAATLIVVVFFAGFLFVDRGSISGNIIVDNGYSASVISIIGLVLVLCAVILAAYLIRKR